MYKIGMFSKHGKVTVKTLRHYDEAGLLKPAYIDEETGYRYYTTDQLSQLHEIIALRQMGFSIPEIRSIIDNINIDKILEQRKNELESEYQIITNKLFRLNYYISEKKEGKNMNYQVVIKEIPECIVFSKRQIIRNYNELMELVPSVGKKITEANPTLKCAEPEYCFNIYHDGEYKEKDIDVEICQAVVEFGKETDGIIFKKIPGVTVVSVMHKGPYSDFGAAYAFIFKWIEQNNHVVVDNVRESYIDGIWNKESENEWLTEIQVPIAQNKKNVFYEKK